MRVVLACEKPKCVRKTQVTHDMRFTGSSQTTTCHGISRAVRWAVSTSGRSSRSGPRLVRGVRVLVLSSMMCPIVGTGPDSAS